ncbi:Na+/H+ antiporter subunit G [Sphingomonas sp. 37zxx]|uniref:Na+/H+ antiporter subunit G n=1 Tax=Sphingomonas sp. 37zxx TaxID=1550073 RepID=UPI00053BE57A|nr:Na+/H+ antiporter subunit G [Sphingomonas sp. 37zxx]
MNGVMDIMVTILVLIGGGFVLIGSWGLVRLPSTMERLHGPTKATTLGLGALLLASMLYFQAKLGMWSAHEVLISLFLFITAPISANMIAKVHLHRVRIGAITDRDSIAGPPPRPATGGDWATFEAPEQDTPASTANT